MPLRARPAQTLTLGNRQRPLRLLRPDLDELRGGDRSPARRARAKGSRAGRSPPQRPASNSVLAPCPPPVVVRAGAGPVAGVDDVHRASRTANEETGTAVADPDADRALAPAGQVRDDDVLGAGYARGESGAGGSHSGEFLLDAPRDGLDYTGGVHSCLLSGCGPGSGEVVLPRGRFFIRHWYSTCFCFRFQPFLLHFCFRLR